MVRAGARCVGGLHLHHVAGDLAAVRTDRSRRHSASEATCVQPPRIAGREVDVVDPRACTIWATAFPRRRVLLDNTTAGHPSAYNGVGCGVRNHWLFAWNQQMYDRTSVSAGGARRIGRGGCVFCRWGGYEVTVTGPSLRSRGASSWTASASASWSRRRDSKLSIRPLHQWPNPPLGRQRELPPSYEATVAAGGPQTLARGRLQTALD